MKNRSFPLLLFLFVSASLGAQIELPRIFTDHMVVQRHATLTVRGSVPKIAKVAVDFRGETYTGKADKTGTFSLEIPTGAAGGPFDLIVRTKQDTRTLRDVLVGDVWLCSGQSNMEWEVQSSNNAAAEIAAANDARIRHYKVPRTYAGLPQTDLEGGEWERTSPETAGQFTAVGYFFAREIRARHDVPIGLLNSSWGGSRIEPWMSAQAMGYEDAETAGKKMQAELEARNRAAVEKLEALLGEIPTEDAGMSEDGTALWAQPIREPKNWRPIEVPGLWEATVLPDLDGIVWLKRQLEIPAELANQAAELHLGPIDDSDRTYVNGQLVGQMEQRYDAPRVYPLPNGLPAGTHDLTVRVDDTGGGGGIYGAADELYLKIGDRIIPLAGEWQFRVGKADVGSGANANVNQRPVLLHNSMIAPVQDFPIAGVLWYQGESNAGNFADADTYADLFQTLITSWRAEWQQPDLPFYWVQLANFMAPDAQPTESAWANLRRSQSAALELPHTAEAVIIDIGEADDIHPRNKQDVGARLARAARAQVYGETDLIFRSPTLRKAEREDAGVKLHFDHAGDGLEGRRDRYGYLRGFALQDADGTWHWAMAMPKDDDTLYVWHPAVERPQAVRYAWANNPDDANVYSSEGLPMGPFEVQLE